MVLYMECVCIMHKNERSAHAQIISWQQDSYEVKNSVLCMAE